MINLLPPKEKEYLLREKKKRIILVFWFLLGFFIICLIFLLLLFNVYFYYQIKEKQEKINFQDKNEKENIISLENKIKVMNDNLKKLNFFYHQKIYFSQVLEDFAEVIPEGVFIKSVSITFVSKNNNKEKSKQKKEEGRLEISVFGFASDRDKLFNFRENLQKSRCFKDVYFPPSNWVKPENINFFVSLKYK